VQAPRMGLRFSPANPGEEVRAECGADGLCQWEQERGARHVRGAAQTTRRQAQATSMHRSDFPVLRTRTNFRIIIMLPLFSNFVQS
jgi:hypothetical protein